MTMICMLSVFVLILCLSGCAVTSENDLVSQKNVDRLEAAAQETPEGKTRWRL
ncbi:MAG: hypothetical protein LUE23_09895 [Lachnospiraceae bacterium]|nr:hypothetical protein [Lachnospiraceae bacterium]